MITSFSLLVLALGLAGCTAPVPGGSVADGPTGGKADGERDLSDEDHAELQQLRAEARAAAQALYQGRPGIPAFGSNFGTTSAVESAVDAIMAAGGPVEVEMSLRTFEDIAESAGSIYDEVWQPAYDLFFDPLVAEAYAFLVGSTSATALAHHVAGSLAGVAFGIGEYTPITGNPAADRANTVRYDVGIRYVRQIWEAEERANEFLSNIDEIRSGVYREAGSVDDADRSSCTTSCQDGYEYYDRTYGAPCGCEGTCWKSTSDGEADGGVDSSLYTDWEGYWLMCPDGDPNPLSSQGQWT
jgi:hypothetical protein